MSGWWSLWYIVRVCVKVKMCKRIFSCSSAMPLPSRWPSADMLWVLGHVGCLDPIYLLCKSSYFCCYCRVCCSLYHLTVSLDKLFSCTRSSNCPHKAHFSSISSCCIVSLPAAPAGALTLSVSAPAAVLMLATSAPIAVTLSSTTIPASVLTAAASVPVQAPAAATSSPASVPVPSTAAAAWPLASVPVAAPAAAWRPTSVVVPAPGAVVSLSASVPVLA